MKGFGTYFKTSMALAANWYVLIGFWAIIVWQLDLRIWGLHQSEGENGTNDGGV